jgi:hypothetical protein
MKSEGQKVTSSPREGLQQSIYSLPAFLETRAERRARSGFPALSEQPVAPQSLAAGDLALRRGAEAKVPPE